MQVYLIYKLEDGHVVSWKKEAGGIDVDPQVFGIKKMDLTNLQFQKLQQNHIGHIEKNQLIQNKNPRFLQPDEIADLNKAKDDFLQKAETGTVTMDEVIGILKRIIL